MCILTGKFITAVHAILDPVLHEIVGDAFSVVASPEVLLLTAPAESILELRQCANRWSGLGGVKALDVPLSVPGVAALIGEEIATFNWKQN